MNNRLQEQLPAMFALAHQRSDGARVELAGLLADLFLSTQSQLNLREEQLVNELIDQLLQAKNPAVRRALVEKFADLGRMPRRMALTLACDDIDTARSILANNLMLTDDDLIKVVETQSRDHAKSVATRQAINEAVADALIVTGDVEVMQIVAENLGAKLSSKAVSAMLEAARFASDLRDPLARRPEMTMDSASQLYWLVSQDLRRYILKRFGIVAGQIDEALAKMVDELLSDHMLTKNDDETMTQVADWLAQCGASSPRVLPQVLRMGHFRLFNILLSRMTKLDLSVVDLVVESSGGRALAVLCRAIEIEKATFVSIFLLSRAARTGEQVVHPRELSHALAAFDRLDAKLAQDLLVTWQRDPSYLRQRQDELMLDE